MRIETTTDGPIELDGKIVRSVTKRSARRFRIRKFTITLYAVNTCSHSIWHGESWLIHVEFDSEDTDEPDYATLMFADNLCELRVLCQLFRAETLPSMIVPHPAFNDQMQFGITQAWDAACNVIYQQIEANT